jgi:opacity protein-like surface antigen
LRRAAGNVAGAFLGPKARPPVTSAFRLTPDGLRLCFFGSPDRGWPYYGWGQTTQYDSIGFSPTWKMQGYVEGATIGYDWQLGKRLVVGAEADLSHANIIGRLGPGFFPSPHPGSGSTPSGWDCAPCETDVDWFGTVRGRIGFAFDQLQPYGTGGAAFGRVNSLEVDCGGGCADQWSMVGVRVGWRTGRAWRTRSRISIAASVGSQAGSAGHAPPG